ncbi:MAG: DUF4232 domain-containing protein [Acidimicrobiales bacterium]
MRRSLCALGVIATTFGIVPTFAGAADARSTHSNVPLSCLASDLTATGFWEGATNSMAGTVWFTNKGTQSCSLRGYLPVTLRTQDGKALPVVVRREGITLVPPPARHPSAVVLAPSVQHAAEFLFQWWNWCRPNPGPLSVHVALTSRRSLTVMPMDGGFPAVTAGCIAGAHTRSWLALAPVGKPR